MSADGTGRSALRRGLVRMVADQFQRTTTDAPPKQVVFGVIGLTIALDMAPPPRDGAGECKATGLG